MEPVTPPLYRRLATFLAGIVLAFSLMLPPGIQGATAQEPGSPEGNDGHQAAATADADQSAASIEGLETGADALPLVAASQLTREVQLQPLPKSGGVPLVADALAGKPTRFVNQEVPLAGEAEPVLGSFTVDGLTYAATGEGTVELVAVAPAILADDLVAALAGTASVNRGDASSGEDSGSGAPPQSETGQAPSEAASPSPEGASSNGPEDEEASGPVVLEVPESVGHDGLTYSVTTIGPRAFAGCDADVALLPATVESVDEAAFRGSSVGDVKVAEGNPYLASYEGVLYDADLKSLLLIPEGKQGAVRIPKAAEVVPADAFSHCASVTAIEADAGSAAFTSEDEIPHEIENKSWITPSLAHQTKGTEFWPYNTADLPTSATPKAAIEQLLTIHNGPSVIDWRRADSVNHDIYRGTIKAEASRSFKHTMITPISILRNGWFQIDEKLSSSHQGHPYSFTAILAGFTYDPAYKFSHWTDDPDSKQPIDELPMLDTYHIWAVYALRTADVTFDLQDGSEPFTAPSFATFGKKLPDLPLPLPTRPGYKFIGFFDSLESSEATAYYDAAGDPTRPWDKQGHATLYARWEPQVTHIVYDLSSEPRSATDADAGSWPEGVEPPSSATPDAGCVRLPSPARPGYAFMGWMPEGLPNDDTLLAESPDGTWSLDTAKLPDYADADNKVTLVARWSSVLSVDVPSTATFLYDLSRFDPDEPRTAYAEGGARFLNRSNADLRVSGLESQRGEAASALALADPGPGGTKVLAAFPDAAESSASIDDAKRPAAALPDHAVSFSLDDVLLEAAFDPEAWKVPANGTMAVGYRLNLGQGASLDPSALVDLGALPDGASHGPGVTIATITYCFALADAPQILARMG